MERLTQRDNENDYVYFTRKPKGFLCGENFCSYAYKCDKIKDRKCPYLAMIDRLASYEDTGLEPQEIERIVDAYGRCQTLRTESAQRLEIIREIPTEKLSDMAKQYRMSKLAKPYRYGKFVNQCQHEFVYDELHNKAVCEKCGYVLTREDKSQILKNSLELLEKEEGKNK